MNDHCVERHEDRQGKQEKQPEDHDMLPLDSVGVITQKRVIDEPANDELDARFALADAALPTLREHVINGGCAIERDLIHLHRVAGFDHRRNAGFSLASKLLLIAENFGRVFSFGAKH
jgi:hypothetical protein